jgi:hypothetical protein
MCHRTVSGAPGPYRVQPATLEKNAGALHYNSPDCPVSQRGNGYLARNGRLWQRYSVAAEVRAASQSGTGPSGAPPDCPVPQEDNSANGRLLQNPNGWVTWWRTGPIDSSFPNGYFGGWGL